MSHLCLESQDCHLISLFPPLFFCLVLLLFLSCHFSANGLFSRKFSNVFVKSEPFCMALVEQLGDVSW